MSRFKMDSGQLEFVGSELQRPECVLCTRDGSVYISDWRGGVTCINSDGSQRAFLDATQPSVLRPNGIALDRDGSFLLAHLGDEDGGVWRLRRDGTVEPFVVEVGGEKLPPTNFVMIDRKERVWITVSTRLSPRARGYRKDVADGFVVLVDSEGSRIVADGIGYANEVQLDASGEWLYVNETFGRKLTRFRVGKDGRLSGKETVAVFGHGTYPDGLCFDVEGGVWVTSIVSNRVIRVDTDGSQDVVLEDHDPGEVDRVESAFAEGRMDRSHLGTSFGRRLRNVSSVAFGGADLQTVYLGCLLGDAIATFRSPVAGLAPAHWEW